MGSAEVELGIQRLDVAAERGPGSWDNGKIMVGTAWLSVKDIKDLMGGRKGLPSGARL